MPEEKSIDYDLLEKALFKEMREIMREDSLNVYPNRIAEKIPTIDKMVDRINKLMPEEKKFTENEMKDLKKSFLCGYDFAFDYQRDRDKLYTYSISGMNKSFGEKLLTSARIGRRFLKNVFDTVRDLAFIIIFPVAFVVGNVISAIGYVAGAIPIVGTILRHIPGSCSNYHYDGFLFESKRINVIRNIGDEISYFGLRIFDKIGSGEERYPPPPAATVHRMLSIVKSITLQRNKARPSPAKREIDNNIKTQIDNSKKDVVKENTATSQFPGPPLVNVVKNRNGPVYLQKDQPMR